MKLLNLTVFINENWKASKKFNNKWMITVHQLDGILCKSCKCRNCSIMEKIMKNRGKIENNYIILCNYT